MLELHRTDDGSNLVETRRHFASKLCGPTPSGTFARAIYQPDAGRFVRNVELDKYLREADRLAASVPNQPLAGPFTRGVYQWYWATSAEESSKTTSGAVRPMQLGDRRGASAWTVDAGDGVRGQFATANVVEALPVHAVQVVPGYPKDEKSYRSHRRPTEVVLAFSDGTRFVVSLPDVDYRTLVARRGLLVELPEPVETTCMSVLLLSAHGSTRAPGRSDSLSVAEVAPVTTVDARTAEKTAAKIVERMATEPDLRARRHIAHAASGVRSKLAAAVSDALDNTEGIERRRILPLLDNLSPDRAVPTLMEYYRALDRGDVEYRAVKRGLASHGARAAEPLVDLLDELDVEDPKYIDTIRLVGRVGESTQLEALAGDFGHGPESVRNARIRAVASAGESVLSRLFSIAAVGGSEVRTRDALKAIHLVGRRQRNELDEHSGADSLLEVIERTDNRRTQLHAFRAARHYRVEGLVDRTRKRYIDHPDALVRKAAVEAVARYPGTEARQLSERALRDRNPDVRIAAASGIGRRQDRRRSTGPLLDYVREEGWSSGQQQALEVLAEVEVPETQKFFRELVLEHRSSELAVRAARVLSRASRPVDAQVAEEIILDEDASGRLRAQMVELLGFEQSPGGEALLLTLLNPAEMAQRVRNADLRRDMELRAVMALGRRRSYRARDRLLKLAKTGSDERLRRRAIRGLAFFRGDDLAEKLQAWRSEAPPSLRSTIDQTIGIIQNRDRIDRVRREIDKTLESEPAGSPDDSTP